MLFDTCVWQKKKHSVEVRMTPLGMKKQKQQTFKKVYVLLCIIVVLLLFTNT